METDRLEEIKELSKKAVLFSEEKNMANLLDILDRTTIVPEVNKYYVFIYKAKTPGITYDQHPLIECTGIFNWGFLGVNVHWGKARRYTWGEVISNLYEVEHREMSILLNYPIAKFKTS